MLRIISLLVFAQTSFAMDQFSDRDLFRIIRTNNDIRTAEDLLSHIPEEIRQHYVIMQTSESLQTTRRGEPRIILFDPSGSIYIAFNAGGNLPGGNTFEVISYDQARGVYNFSEITFDPDQSPRIDANPEKCQACHSESLVPIWNQYAQWPGALPSHDGRFENEFERSQYLEFVENAGKGRYALLAHPDERINRPNRLLANIISVQNADFIVSQIKATKHFESYKYAIVGALRNCTSFLDYFPEALRTRFHQNLQNKVFNTSQSFRDTFATGEYYLDLILGQDFNWEPSELNFSPSQTNRTAKLRYVLERDGHFIYDWFTAIGYNGTRSSTLLKIPKKYFPGILCEPERSRSALQQLMATGTDPLPTGLSNSHDMTQDYEQFATPAQARSFHTADRLCARCHEETSTNTGPLIPFGDLEKMREMLRSTDIADRIKDRMTRAEGDGGLMPPGNKITATTYLNTYFESLDHLSADN